MQKWKWTVNYEKWALNYAEIDQVGRLIEGRVTQVSRETTIDTSCFTFLHIPDEKESTVKGKNLLPVTSL